MAIATEPILAITSDWGSLEPPAPAVGHPRQPSTATDLFGDSHPADAPGTTEEMLRQRDRLSTGDLSRAKLRARAIKDNLPLSRKLARRYSGRGELLDDLTQVAALALVKAVDGYDPSRGASFVGYAVPTILGAIKRHFRDTTWGVRVPRSIQELARESAIATGELSQRHGRVPTPVELAEHLHVTCDDLLKAVSARRGYRLESLNTPHADGGGGISDLIGDTDPGYAHVDDRLSLQPFLEALPSRERRILILRFYGRMTQTQIAAEVGLSQMHVSRLLRKSLTRLRIRMTR